MYINKDTKIYCSFGRQAGNKGCEYFNHYFLQNNIDAIYKSFSVNNIEDALMAAKTLKFSGCAVAMPYKKEVLKYLDVKDNSVIKSKSANTLIFDNDKIIGYNTDYYGVKKILSSHLGNIIYILGDGGLAGAVKAAALTLNFGVIIINRNNWGVLKNVRNSLVYNCTPLDLTIHKSNSYIDCRIGTEGGNLLYQYQSEKQIQIYTGCPIDLESV